MGTRRGLPRVPGVLAESGLDRRLAARRSPVDCRVRIADVRVRPLIVDCCLASGEAHEDFTNEATRPTKNHEEDTLGPFVLLAPFGRVRPRAISKSLSNPTIHNQEPQSALLNPHSPIRDGRLSVTVTAARRPETRGSRRGFPTARRAWPCTHHSAVDGRIHRDVGRSRRRCSRPVRGCRRRAPTARRAWPCTHHSPVDGRYTAHVGDPVAVVVTRYRRCHRGAPTALGPGPARATGRSRADTPR